MKYFEILFGSTEKKTIPADSLLKGQLAAHKAAAAKKTIVIRVTEVSKPNNK
jgi:hypothetical protein